MPRYTKKQKVAPKPPPDDDPMDDDEPTPAAPAARQGTTDIEVINESEFSAFDAKVHIPENAFVCVFAPRRSGKTETVLSFLRVFHQQKRFTHFFLVSETLSGYEEYIPQTAQFTNLDHVAEIIARMQKVAVYNKKQKEKSDMIDCSICLILDDVVGNPKDLQARGSILAKIAVNGRHICREDPNPNNQFVCFLISQRITLIPPPIRNNADIILASRLASYNERKTLIENYLSMTSDRYGLRRARGVFDAVTMSKAFRFIAICTHLVSSKTHAEFVFKVDANIKEKSVHLCGTVDDWKCEKQTVIF
jgi:hypothetical protein